MLVERLRRGRDHVVRHRGVDLAGELDEARVEVPLLRFPRKIERVHRDAVPAEAGSGIERLESEGLGLRCLDHFPDVDAHAQREQLQFVDQRDIHAAIDVLEQLGHLRSGRARDRHDRIEDGAIKRGRDFAGARVEPTNHFRDIAPRDRVITRILTLGRERYEERILTGIAIACGLQSGAVLRFQDRYHDFFGRPGIGRALEYDELPGAQVRGNGIGRSGDVAEVGLAHLVQRRGHADHDRVHLRDVRIIGGGGKAALPRRRDVGRRDAIDVGAAFRQRGDLLRVHVEAGDGELLFAEQQCQGKPDITQADDAHACAPRLDLRA